MFPRDKLPDLTAAALFHTLDHALLQDLLPSLGWLFLPGGRTLFREGETGDALYIVLSGRLRVTVGRCDGSQEAIREIGRGESVGELALLTGKARSATVRAIRDTELVEFSRAAFESLIRKYPQLVSRLAVQIADRQSEGDDRSLSRRNIRTLAILPFDQAVPTQEFSARTIEVLQQLGSTRCLSSRSGEAECRPAAGPLRNDGRGSARLSALESAHRFIVYQADPAVSAWTERCVRQADLILVIAAADRRPEPARLESLQRYFSSREITAAIELALLHRRGYDARVKTDPWLRFLSPQNHHHVVLNETTDLQKLVRLLTGSAVGLVLSGGGARGFAHIGAIRALDECGIPIDAIGGTSMGAVIAAQYALGWDWRTMARVNADQWPRCEPQKNYTLPLVALNSGRRMDRMLRTMFGGAEMENLRTRFFCVSTNLTRARATIHRAGVLWKAVRASVSIPGIGPPAIENGEILVDGGLVNNLPVDVMKKLSPGRVLAVDVSEQLEFRSKLRESYSVSGWKLLGQRLNPFSDPPDIPNMLNILYRTTTVGSLPLLEAAKSEADFYLSPPVHHFNVFDWRSADKIIDIGYRDALARIAAAGDRLWSRRQIDRSQHGTSAG